MNSLQKLWRWDVTVKKLLPGWASITDAENWIRMLWREGPKGNAPFADLERHLKAFDFQRAISFTPWLQPGGGNGLVYDEPFQRFSHSGLGEAVETAGWGRRWFADHRAEAAV